jgi:hypothetical protein
MISCASSANASDQVYETEPVAGWLHLFEGLSCLVSSNHSTRGGPARTTPKCPDNNFFGAIDVDIEGELAQLGPTGYRPLRVADTLF